MRTPSPLEGEDWGGGCDPPQSLRIEPLSLKRGGSNNIGVVHLLHLRVGQPCGAAHQAAAEAMRQLKPVGIDPQFDEQAAAVLIRTQAAPAVRQCLGQHRHDAVGEIDRVAAVRAASLQRADPGPHVMRPRRQWRRSAGSRQGASKSSGSANTASSKSRASSPSIVTSGTSRRSVRRPSVVARAWSASSRAGLRKFDRDVMRVDGDEADRARVAHGGPVARSPWRASAHSAGDGASAPPARSRPARRRRPGRSV